MIGLPKSHLRQPRFTFRTCRPFIKYRKRIKKFKETNDLNYINKIKTKYLLCVVYAFNKYAWVISFKGKKAKTVCNGFTGIVNESERNPNKLWVKQEKEFYYILMEKWLDNNILMYSTYNEHKSVVADSFIRTLKGNI